MTSLLTGPLNLNRDKVNKIVSLEMEIVRVLNDLIYYQHVFTLENERFQSQG